MSEPAVRFEAGPGSQEVVLTHTFSVPPDRVFRAYTDPEEIPLWWGPSELTTEVEELEVRRGGCWRFFQSDPQQRLHAFHGVHHEVTPGRRLVRTFEYEGAPGHVLLETVTFTAIEGGTLLTTRSVFQSAADRDQMVAAGMERGAVESMERLGRQLGSA